MQKNRIYLGVLFLVLLGFSVFAISSRRSEVVEEERSPRPVGIIKLARLGERRVRVFPGEVRPAEQANLSFRVAGTLQNIAVVRGTELKRGDLVAVLDKRDFESNLNQTISELERAQSQLNAMQTGARQQEVLALSAQVNASRARFNEAKLTLGRYSSLLSAGAVSRAEYDRIKANHDVAREDLKVAEQNLDIAKTGSRLEDIQAQQANIRGLEARVKMAEDALNDTELRAPFDGIVAEKFVDNFQSVQQKQPVIAFQNIRNLDVAVAIPGNMVLNLDPDAAISVRGDFIYTAQARFPTLPDRLFNLVFKEVSTLGNVQSQTYRVTFSMAKPLDLLVLPGMGLDVLLTEHKNDTVSRAFPVPLSAVASGESGQHFVWKINDSTGRLQVQRILVSVEGFVDDRCLIVGDLADGERIVAAGLSYLQDGDEVRIYSFPRNEAEIGDQQ